MKTEYSCNCINNENDITYGSEFDTLEEALKQVNHYKELISNNGEKDIHSHIEVVKYQVDEDTGDTIDGTWKVLRKFAIEGE